MSESDEGQETTVSNGELAVYAAVAARRLQWDSLLWQVPVLSLTAQAFLLTISLGGGTARAARCLAALLSMIAAIVSMILMAGHRHAELTDAHWLGDFERDRLHADLVVHGPAYKARRDETPMVTEPSTFPMRFFAKFARPRTFNYWMGCLLAFGLVGLFALVAAAAGSSLLR